MEPVPKRHKVLISENWTQTVVEAGMSGMWRKPFVEHLELCPISHLCTSGQSGMKSGNCFVTFTTYKLAERHLWESIYQLLGWIVYHITHSINVRMSLEASHCNLWLSSLALLSVLCSQMWWTACRPTTWSWRSWSTFTWWTTPRASPTWPSWLSTASSRQGPTWTCFFNCVWHCQGIWHCDI